MQLAKSVVQPLLTVHSMHSGAELLATHSVKHLLLPQETVSPKQDAHSEDKPEYSARKQSEVNVATPNLEMAHRCKSAVNGCESIQISDSLVEHLPSPITVAVKTAAEMKARIIER